MLKASAFIGPVVFSAGLPRVIDPFGVGGWDFFEAMHGLLVGSWFARGPYTMAPTMTGYFYS